MDPRSDRYLSPLFSACFMQAVMRELREYGLEMILRQQNLIHLMPGQSAASRGLRASEFAALQAGLRRYYGRGARSLLTRIGRGMWPGLVKGQPPLKRMLLGFQRLLPGRLGVRSTLEFLVKLIRHTDGNIAVHTAGQDLVLVDYTSDGTWEQQSSEPVCWLMQGLAQEALFWATRMEYEVEEIACRAMGDAACQFKIRRDTGEE